MVAPAGWGWLLSVASVAWPAATREEKAKRATYPVLREQWGEETAAAQAGKTAGQDAGEQGARKEGRGLRPGAETEGQALRLRKGSQ